MSELRLAVPASGPLLSVAGLTVQVATPTGPATVVDEVSFDLGAGEVLGIVGELGSGKSLSMLAIIGLVPSGALVQADVLRLAGNDITRLDEAALQSMRGKAIAMIFQEPMTSLNPVLNIGRQVGDAIRAHAPKLTAADERERVLSLLRRVRIADPERRLRQYPHELSGGMRQRVVIAIAIANDPVVLVADEPTTALDVTIQAQVMELLADVGPSEGRGMLLVTHDLGLVAENADRVVVMYAGRIVEIGSVQAVFDRPAHPYTASLLASLPRLDRPVSDLQPIPGQPPTAGHIPNGCAFHPRCQHGKRQMRCEIERPELRSVGAKGQASACHFARDVTERGE